MSYKNNIKSTFITRVLSLGISFVISVILARALGATNRGYLQYLLLIISLLSQFGHLSIIDATTYFQKRSEYSEQVVYNSNFIVLVALWIIESIIILFLRAKGIMLVEYNYSHIIISLITVLFTFIVSLITALDTGNNRIKHINKVALIGIYAKFGVVILLLLIGRLTILAYLFVTLLHLLIQLIILFYNYKNPLRIKVEFLLVLQEVKFGFFVYLASLFIFLNYRADQFMIKELLSITDLGVYVIAVTIAELIFTVPNSVISSYRGEMYRIETDDKIGKSKKISLTISTIKYTYLFSIALSIIVFFASFLIPIVYGQEYQGAVGAIQLLLPGIIFGTVGKVSANYYVIEGKPKIHMFVSLLVLIINIILNYYLIEIMGINGAAVASTLSYFVYGLIYIVLLSITDNIDYKRIVHFTKNDFNRIRESIGKTVNRFRR